MKLLTLLLCPSRVAFRPAKPSVSVMAFRWSVERAVAVEGLVLVLVLLLASVRRETSMVMVPDVWSPFFFNFARSRAAFEVPGPGSGMF